MDLGLIGLGLHGSLECLGISVPSAQMGSLAERERRTKWNSHREGGEMQSEAKNVIEERLKRGRSERGKYGLRSPTAPNQFVE